MEKSVRPDNLPRIWNLRNILISGHAVTNPKIPFFSSPLINYHKQSTGSAQGKCHTSCNSSGWKVMDLLWAIKSDIKWQKQELNTHLYDFKWLIASWKQSLGELL